VVFSEHVLTDYLPGVERRDEEGWLNEGLCHLAEDMHGFGWSNLDYRISAFLSCPARYGLVVPDYYAAGLWRSHGHRGAAYLFLRWCADTFGPDLPARLIQTNLSGTRNIEVATLTPFPALFRRWSAGLVSDASKKRNFQPLAGRLLCGPRTEEVTLAGDEHQVRIAGTGMAYLLLHSPAAAHARLKIQTTQEAHLQVSLIRLPCELPRLSLRWQRSGVSPSGKLILTAHDAGVTLDHAAWERLIPTSSRPEDTSYRPGARPDDTVRGWFGDPHLNAGQSRASVPITLPSWAGCKDPLIFKATGIDAAGRRCAAWAVAD
jgi:hypothetical protein